MLAPLDTQEDEDLLARLRAGDEVAFHALVDRHRPWLVRLCTRLLGDDAHAAEDAAQESLLKLHAAARRDGRPLRVRAWLTVVARNTCIDEQRRRRPDLPGVLPERAVSWDDPFSLDAALAEAWPRLAGRHREVLYLREVLGFSYKEIGSVMGLSMPAVETLVFRARAALRREYERAGGTGLGCGLFGFHLLRRRFASDLGPGAPVADPGAGPLTARLTHFLTTLPGCGEQAVAKVLSVAAGVAMAAAAVVPGVGPFADAPAAATGGAEVAAAVGAPPVAPASAGTPTPTTTAKAPTGPVTLKALLGNAVPDGWSPQRSTGAAAITVAAASGRPARATPLRDALAGAHSDDRPTLRRDDDRPGPLRTILTARPEGMDQPVRPVGEQPIRSLLTSLPSLLEPLPVEAAPDPEEDQQPVQSTLQAVLPAEAPVALRDALPLGGGNVADREPALLQRRNG